MAERRRGPEPRSSGYGVDSEIRLTSQYPANPKQVNKPISLRFVGSSYLSSAREGLSPITQAIGPEPQSDQADSDVVCHETIRYTVELNQTSALSPCASTAAIMSSSSLSEVSPVTPTAPMMFPNVSRIKTPPATGTNDPSQIAFTA